MPTIEWTPLKTNTLTVTANKFNDAAASNAIALSIGKEKSRKKKNKATNEKDDKEAPDYKERLELQRKITKINQLIPQVVDGYCNSYRKILDSYKSKVEDRVTRNYKGHILGRCIDHDLSRNEEKQFTPKPCDLDYAKKNNPETDKETEQHSTNDYLTAEHNVKAASDNVNAIQNANVSFNLV
jgi:hypothetical protein